jgi:hypothetical protein
VKGIVAVYREMNVVLPGGHRHEGHRTADKLERLVEEMEASEATDLSHKGEELNALAKTLFEQDSRAFHWVMNATVERQLFEADVAFRVEELAGADLLPQRYWENYSARPLAWLLRHGRPPSARVQGGPLFRDAEAPPAIEFRPPPRLSP